MVPNAMMFRAASALIAVGIVLGLANWYARPEAALAWTAVLAMFVVMVAALASFILRKQLESLSAAFQTEEKN